MSPIRELLWELLGTLHHVESRFAEDGGYPETLARVQRTKARVAALLSSIQAASESETPAKLAKSRKAHTYRPPYSSELKTGTRPPTRKKPRR